MGWHEKSITIRGVCSAHNSINDELDSVKWNWLAKDIKRLVASGVYESIAADVIGPEDD